VNHLKVILKTLRPLWLGGKEFSFFGKISNELGCSVPGLETERLVLRKLQLSDAASLLTVLADEKVTRFYDDVDVLMFSLLRGEYMKGC